MLAAFTFTLTSVMTTTMTLLPLLLESYVVWGFRSEPDSLDAWISTLFLCGCCHILHVLSYIYTHSMPLRRLGGFG